MESHEGKEKFECGDCGVYYWVEDRNNFNCPNCEDKRGEDNLTKKEKLIKLGNRCSELAEMHRRTEKLFGKLFEDIYKIEYDPNEMDFLVDCIQYGTTNMTLKSLEDGIKRVKKSWKSKIEFLNKDGIIK